MVRRVGFTGESDGGAGIGRENFRNVEILNNRERTQAAVKAQKQSYKEKDKGDHEHQPQTITLI